MKSFFDRLMPTSSNSSAIQHTDCPDSPYPLNISPEIKDLIWIGDGKYKNYTRPQKQTPKYNTIKIVFSSEVPEEPSTIYLSLPITKPPKDYLLENPPYYPSYKYLTPEQRWMYWRFLADPFSPQNNIGYVFLFYYGLERHLLWGNLDKSFDIILKLRRMYNNPSFQSYSSSALTLICIEKQRADLALKFLEDCQCNENTSISMDYLLALKYTFQIPLTASEIIKYYQYFGFTNNRYIKNHPDLFKESLLKLIQREFHSNNINLSLLFPVYIEAFTTTPQRIFANPSLGKYEVDAPIFNNKKFIKKILCLLNETHETVKNRLKELRKQGMIEPEKKPTPIAKLSPIEEENIPKKLSFDFSDFKDLNSWSFDDLLNTYFKLSETIQNESKILPRLEACEKSYIILKPVIDHFLKDSAGLPPFIPCREYGYGLYRKLGNWNDAKRILRFSLYLNSYKNPDEGTAELEYLARYEEIGKIAIDFIQKNPGFLQKNIYKALSQQIPEEDISILKDFMRETYVFHKQPCNGTNKLYYVERK